MTTLVLQPGATGMDAMVWTDYPDANYSTDGNSHHRRNVDASTMRSFHKWDLSDIPVGSIIREATVEYYRGETGGGSGGIYDRLQRCTADWDESTITWNNQPGVEAGYMGTIPYGVTGSTCIIELDAVEFGLMFVTNYGYRIFGREDAVPTTGSFASSDTPTEAYRPKLTVVYDPPGGASFLVPRLLNPDAPHETKLMTGWIRGESGLISPVSPYVKDREKEKKTEEGLPSDKGIPKYEPPPPDKGEPKKPSPPPKRYPKK